MQTKLEPKLAAIGNSFLGFSQNIIGSISVTIANTIFQEVLRSGIHDRLPDVDEEMAIAAGGKPDAVRQLVPPGPQQDALLEVYSDSVSAVFYFMVGTTLLSFLAAFGMGWVSLKAKPEPQKEAEKKAEV